MNITLADIQNQYFPDAKATEVIDKDEIQRLLDSKTSCTWGCGQKLEGGWVVLCQPSPSRPGDAITVFVCREANIVQSKATLSVCASLEIKLAQSEKLSKKLKAKLKTAKMRENLGQNELRELTEFIGSDIHLRIDGVQQVFISVIKDFNEFIDRL